MITGPESIGIYEKKLLGEDMTTEEFIDYVNFNYPEEAKRWRILLAVVLKRLDGLKPEQQVQEHFGDWGASYPLTKATRSSKKLWGKQK